MVVVTRPAAHENELLGISNVLLGAALQGRTACHVTQALSDLVDEAVFLLSRDLHVWAKAVPERVREPLIEEMDRTGELPQALSAAGRESGGGEAFCSGDRARVIAGEPGRPELVVCPISAGGDGSGYVLMTHSDPEREEVILAAAQHLAVVAGLYLLRLRAVNAVEEQARSAVVYALIDGLFASQDELVERATVAGFRAQQPHVAVVIESVAPAGTPARAAARLLSTRERAAFVADLSGRAVAVIEAEEIEETHRRVQALQVELAHDLHVEVRIGVGSVAREPGAVAQSYREAVRALRLVASPQQPVAFHEEARLFTLLDAIPDRGTIERYCRMILGPLFEPWAPAAARLRQTMEALAGHGYNQAEAARVLYLHKNTVRYQVGRIAELSGLDLSDPRHQLEATLALQAERFLRATEGGRL